MAPAAARGGSSYLVEIRPFTADDAAAVHAYAAVRNACVKVDAPWAHGVTDAGAEGYLRHGWDLEPPVPFLAYVDGVPVGYAEYHTSAWDNQHLAWVSLGVHPDHRRRGVGSALFAAMLDRARAEGRTSVGADGWESPAAEAFAARHGLERRSQAINRRQVLAEVDWASVEALHAEAARHATSYEIVRLGGRTPEDELPALAALTASINDAPTDDLDIEDEVFPPERVRNYETAQLARDQHLHRVVARHRETGALGGHTVVLVERARPGIGHQHDTAVDRAHRGHRLGLLLKAEMLLWLREEQPALATVDTWNAESNDHMIAVNDRLGYRVLGRELHFQRAL